MREEYRQRLAKEYRYAVTKMQEVTPPARKLFYFSVIFGDAQRILNWEWSRNLALIHSVTQHVHTQINSSMQAAALNQATPMDWAAIFDALTVGYSNLAAYFEKKETENSGEELCQILGYLAEIGFTVTGNGSYLYEKGIIKF